MISLSEYFRGLQALFPCPVAIAGGAVRDALLGRSPRDIDLYVLGTDPDEAPRILEGLRGHGFEPRPVATPYPHCPVGEFDMWGQKVQVMAAPHESVQDLMLGFDFTICQFAFDADGHKSGPKGTAPLEGPLELGFVRDPYWSLCRAFDFKSRYSVELPEDVVVNLCRQVAARSS